MTRLKTSEKKSPRLVPGLRWKAVYLFERFRENKAAVFGLCVASFFIILALIAPILFPGDPTKVGTASFKPPSLDYIMGTDDLGRDILARFAYGSRISITVGLLAAGISTLLGILVGALSGFYGGKIDDVLMRTLDFFQIIPRLLMLLVLATLFAPSFFNTAFAIGVLSWPRTARLLRAEMLSLREREFVTAARALGTPNLSIMFSEILPNAIAPVIVNSTLEIANAILLETSVSFLGLGDPVAVSWGSMINSAVSFLREAWWMATFPGLAVMLTVLGFNLVGDGLNDALNPRRVKKF